MKRLLKAALALMMAFGIQVATLSSVDAAGVDLSQPGTYEVPVKSLVSAAPLPPVQEAFAKAFGDSIVVTVDDEGNKIATISLQHMVINLGGENHANVLTIKNGTILSEKVEKSTQGMGGDTEDKTVPEKISVPLTDLSAEGVIQLKITVDFMDAFLGQGSSYETGVTLTLDVDNVTDITPEPVVPEYTLEDGTYTVASDVLKENEDVQSMAASAVKGASVTAKNNTLLVTLQLGAVSMYGQTAYIDKMEVKQADGTYKAADITGHDGDGNVNEMQFTLAKNTKLTNVKFYYGGSDRGSEARLSLGLDNPTPVVPENTSKFATDGTYSVDIALWNATQDKVSMAASAIDSKATVVVKDGVATMYITTKEMVMGSVKAWLEELYIGSSTDDYKANPATIVSKNANGKATMWSFVLPSEEDMFDVVVNPRVAMMGNSDIPARVKVDYATLTKVSDSTDTPKAPDSNLGGNTTTPTNKPTTPTNKPTTPTSSSVKTGDNARSELMGGLLISSLAIAGYLTRKRLCK